jgi:hypothetical protein
MLVQGSKQEFNKGNLIKIDWDVINTANKNSSRFIEKINEPEFKDFLLNLKQPIKQHQLTSIYKSGNLSVVPAEELVCDFGIILHNFRIILDNGTPIDYGIILLGNMCCLVEMDYISKAI